MGISEHKREGERRAKIRDTPEPFSCPPTKDGKFIFWKSWPKRQQTQGHQAQQRLWAGAELETGGLGKDSIPKDEIPQLLILAQLPEHQQPGLCPSPFTLLQPTLSRRIKDSSEKEVSNQRRKPKVTDIWGLPMKLSNNLWIILQ